MDLKELSKSQFGYAIGIRFRNNFSVEDNYGKIIDDILYQKKSYFNASKFPEVVSNINEKVLYDRQNDNRLVINTSNIILDVSNCENLPENKSVEQFKEQLLDNVLVNYNIKQISRIGYVKRYCLNNPLFIKAFRDGLLKYKQDTINNINLQFSQKQTLIEAKIKKNVNDYYNIIYSFANIENKPGLFLTVDFQRIYSPSLESLNGIKFSDFILASNTNDEQVVKFLNNNYGTL